MKNLALSDEVLRLVGRAVEDAPIPPYFLEKGWDVAPDWESLKDTKGERLTIEVTDGDENLIGAVNVSLESLDKPVKPICKLSGTGQHNLKNRVYHALIQAGLPDDADTFMSRAADVTSREDLETLANEFVEFE